MKKVQKPAKKAAKKPAPKKAAKKVASKNTHSQPSAKTAVNSTGITPLADRVLVRPAVADEHTTTTFGIIIPDTAAKEKPEQGTVVAVGPGKRNEMGEVMPMSVEVGDTVVFSKYGYDEVKIEGVEYYIVGEQNILAILDK
jgi:chaperonin GroES